MDSTDQARQATNAATWQHIEMVMRLLASAQQELMRRQFTHDRTKLEDPELETFVEFTPKLKESTYGSNEYKEFLRAMKPAIDYHYEHNRHHPEFFESHAPNLQVSQHLETLEHVEKYLIKDWMPDEFQRWEGLKAYLNAQQEQHQSALNSMNLFDVLEMLIDWKAACQRHADGDIAKSLEINKKRFSISPQLLQILQNTVPWISDEFSQLKDQADLAPKGGKD